MIYWIITGRIEGDDEDSLEVVQCATEKKAVAEFKRCMRERERGGEIYINHAVKVHTDQKPLHTRAP